MTLDQPTLIEFESVRKENKVIPPLGSNSFYNIGNGQINLRTKMNGRFELFTNNGFIPTGMGELFVGINANDPDCLYDSVAVIAGTSMTITNSITFSKASMDVYGQLGTSSRSRIMLSDCSTLTIHQDAILDIKSGTEITIVGGSCLLICGTVKIDVSVVDSFLRNPGVKIDSSAVIDVAGLERLGQRVFSLTNYEAELRQRVINVHTQGERGTGTGKIGCTWTYGSPGTRSQVIKLETLNGEAILGDFKLSAVGIPEMDIPNLQMISDILVREGTTLYITENYHGSRYIRPELYLGIVVGNNSRPADCTIEGTLIVDGVNSTLTLDRGATVHILEDGTLQLVNGSLMRNTYNPDVPSLFIDGTLIIDTIEQIDSFNRENIVFGPKGKVLILNPDTGERKLLWSTPNGIHDSDLYRLFEDHLEQVEYHISNNCGIAIDDYYEFYGRDMRDWYAGRRIEKAIHDGLIVWHSGGFIDLNHKVIPWVHNDGSLLQACRIFKNYGMNDAEKLQDTVNRLQYAGCGDIIFRFIEDGNGISEVRLHLEGINMKSVVYNPLSSGYTIMTDNTGDLFMRNNIPGTDHNEIVNDKARHIRIIENKTDFWLNK